MISALALVAAANVCAPLPEQTIIEPSRIAALVADDNGQGLTRSHRYRLGVTTSLYGSPPPIDDFERLLNIARSGDDAYDAGSRAKALQQYQRAAALIVAHPKSLGGDMELNLARTLFVLGDAVTARRLWTQYLQSSHVDYRPQMEALRSGNYRRFFALSLDDNPEHYSLSYPGDNEGTALTCLTQGLRDGAAGRYIAAQSAFQASLNAITHYPTYPLYAWGAAAYARGERKYAIDAWLGASTSGDGGPPYDMAYNGPANAAAVTMLLGLLDR